MVVRSYPIRVQSPKNGTSGPMGIEVSWKTIAERSGLSAKELEQKEKTSTTGRDRRVAEFNWSLFRKAVTLNGPTDIALTFADYLDEANQDARRYDQLTLATLQFIEEIESLASVPVSLIATRFDHAWIAETGSPPKSIMSNRHEEGRHGARVSLANINLFVRAASPLRVAK
jgi:adenylosuccinate synthase